MEKKLFAECKMTVTKSVEDGQEIYHACASDMTVDRYGEVIDIKGWDLKNFMSNPIMLWAHDASIPPIAKVVKLFTDGQKLMNDFVFAPTAFAQQIKTLVDGGFLNAQSVGFMGKEMKDNVFTKQELFEISIVGIPANPNALLLDFCEKNQLDLVIKAINNKLTKKDFAEMEEKEIKAEEVKEVETKGKVQDVLDIPPSNWELKCQNMDPVFDIFYAFCDAYFTDSTMPTEFIPLLTECISIMQTVVDGKYIDTDEGSEDNGDEDEMETMSLKVKKVFSEELMKNFLQKKAMTAEVSINFSKEELDKFKKSIEDKMEAKAGKVVSAANKEIIQNAVAGIEAVVPMLKELLSLDEEKALQGRAQERNADNVSAEDMRKKAKNNIVRALQLMNKAK